MSLKHIGVSSVIGKKVKLTNDSDICDHLPHCNYLPSFDNFSVLLQENKKYLLEIEKSLVVLLATLPLFDSFLAIVNFTLLYLNSSVYLTLNIILIVSILIASI